MRYNEKIYDIESNIDLVRNRSEVILSGKSISGKKQAVTYIASCGFLSKPLVFSAKNNFSPIFDIGGKFTSIRDTLVATGVPAFSQGEFSRQYFTGAGYTTFNLSTRVVSDLYYDAKKQSIGTLSVVKRIMKTLSPEYISDEQIVDAIEKGIEVVAENVGQFAVAAKDAVDDGIGKFTNSDEDLSTRSVTAIKGILKDTTIAGLKGVRSTINELDKSAQVFGLSIGNFFKCDDMIVKSFTATYSRELDSRGDPLFADLTFEVETREVLTRDGGNSSIERCFGSTETKSRVAIMGGYKPVVKDLNILQ